MARTRASKGSSKAASSKDKEETTTASTSKYSLPAKSTSPPRILILPNKATPEARVVSLKNPRYSKPTRYLICPETGAYELIKISAPKTTPRSWLIASSGAAELTGESDPASFETEVTRGADLYVATPLDPLFLALPALATQFASAGKRMFLSSDDHFDTVVEEQPHLRDTVIRWPRWRARLEARMAAVCDAVEAGDGEPMFRLSEDKLLDQILSKARRMSGEGGLPRSMEEKFVVKALEAPVLSVKKTNPVAVAPEAGDSEPGAESQIQSSESQSSVATTVTSASDASTAPTSAAATDDPGAEALGAADVTSAIQASEDVVGLQRLRVAFNFICSCYVPPAMAAALKKMLPEHKGPGAADFAPLDGYVAELTRLRQEAMMARSASDYSRKRTLDEEDDDRREKRRKKEEEEKRKKAGESRGVRDLKKVNTAGMKKLSAFFKPKGS